MPRVYRAIGENNLGRADAVATVVLIGLGHGLCQLFGTDVEEVFALFHMVAEREKRRQQNRALV